MLLIKSTQARLESISSFSKTYKDDIYFKIEGDVSNSIYYHKSCVSSYTSKQHLERHLKRKAAHENPESYVIKRQRRIAFNFKENCIFCGKKDKQQPDRWRRFVLCRTAYAKHPGQKAFKERILGVCKERGDQIAHMVQLHVEGTTSALHAADARYHADCLSNFTCPLSIASAQKTVEKTSQEVVDHAFNSIINEMCKDKSKLWNTVELHNLYQIYGGTSLSRRNLISQLKTHFASKIAILSSAGVPSVVVFKDDASNDLNLVSDKNDHEMAGIENLAKTIANEVNQIKFDQSHYEIRLTKNDMSKFSSKTLLDLLTAISEGLNDSLPAMMISHIVTSVLSKKATSLQLSLWNLLRDHKSIINELYPFRVTCSYDEVLRFKKSAALAATKDINLSGIKPGSDRLIQAVVDNFDANISSQNGKVTKHPLAMLMTQPVNASSIEGCETEDNTIKLDMKKLHEYSIPIKGPKVVSMPEQFQ